MAQIFRLQTALYLNLIEEVRKKIGDTVINSILQSQQMMDPKHVDMTMADYIGMLINGSDNVVEVGSQMIALSHKFLTYWMLTNYKLNYT